VEIKNGDHDAIAAIDYRADADTSPLSHVFWTYGVTIVASTVKKYCELDCNGELRVI
jgi:hypothetical protein